MTRSAAGGCLYAAQRPVRRRVTRARVTCARDEQATRDVLDDRRCEEVVERVESQRTLRERVLEEGRLGDWSEEGPPAGSALKLVPLVPSEVVASPARMRGAVTMRLPGGIELEFEDAQLSPEWVAALVHEVARAR